MFLKSSLRPYVKIKSFSDVSRFEFIASSLNYSRLWQTVKNEFNWFFPNPTFILFLLECFFNTVRNRFGAIFRPDDRNILCPW